MFHERCEDIRPRWFGQTYDIMNGRIYTVYTVCFSKKKLLSYSVKFVIE